MKKREVDLMITFIILFIASSYVAASFLAVVFMNTAAIYSILAIIMFMSLGLLFIQKARQWAWFFFAISIVLMVAVQALAPYQAILTNVVAIILAILGTVAIKVVVFQLTAKSKKIKWLLRLI